MELGADGFHNRQSSRISCGINGAVTSQTKANQAHFSSNLNLLGCAETAPLGKSGGTVELEI
jgi:hypothetical protein